LGLGVRANDKYKRRLIHEKSNRKKSRPQIRSIPPRGSMSRIWGKMLRRIQRGSLWGSACKTKLEAVKVLVGPGKGDIDCISNRGRCMLYTPRRRKSYHKLDMTVPEPKPTTRTLTALSLGVFIPEDRRGGGPEINANRVTLISRVKWN